MNITNQKLYAGDKWNWIEQLPEYPSTSYTLKLYLKYQDNDTITITASSSGSDHVCSYAASSSAALTAGNYKYHFTVTEKADTDNVITIEQGSVYIFPNLATITDERTNLEKIKDSIDAVLESRASKEQEDIELPGGKKIKYLSLTELIKAKNQIESQIRSERRKERIKQGLGSGTEIKVEFRRT